MKPHEPEGYFYDREKYMVSVWQKALWRSLNFMLPPPEPEACLCPLCSQGDE